MTSVQGLDTPAYSVPGIKLWSLGLPAIRRLYTSVIVLMSEKWALKESRSTDLSPTTIFTQRQQPDHAGAATSAGRRGVPGVWDEGGPGRVYRVLPRTLPGPSY